MVVDPLKFKTLARESNRQPWSSNFNPGTVDPNRFSNDLERLAKEHGYSGVANPNAAFPMAAMFDPTPVTPRAYGGFVAPNSMAYGGRNNERDKVWWHGSVNGDMRGGKTGLHLGTKAAAEDALHARIGFPAEGNWDGTREYGQTLLAGKKTILERNKYGLSGRNVNVPEEDYYAHEHPDGPLKYWNGDAIDPSVKPSIKPFTITGKMTNTVANPHGDWKENGYMQAALKKGSAKSGYFYKNEGEDYGSISAVVPNGGHVEPIDENNTNDINKAKGGAVQTKSVDVSHPNFQSWFGKSVTHDDGVPRKFYTGTSKDVDFPNFKVGRHGVWFTTDPSVASSYAKDNDSQGYRRDGWDMKPVNTASRVIPTYLKAENPYVGELPDLAMKDNYKKSQSEWFDTLRAQGYDSWIPQSQQGNLAVILQHPGQIKSAISNTEAYDPSQSRIDRADGGKTKPKSNTLANLGNSKSIVDKALMLTSRKA